MSLPPTTNPNDQEATVEVDINQQPDLLRFANFAKRRATPEEEKEDTDDEEAPYRLHCKLHPEDVAGDEADNVQEDQEEVDGEENRQVNTLCFLPPISEDGGPIGSVSLDQPFVYVKEERKKTGVDYSSCEVQEVQEGHGKGLEVDEVAVSEAGNKNMNRSKSVVRWSEDTKDSKPSDGKERRDTPYAYERRKSVLVTLFGEPTSYRRFSEDLRPKSLKRLSTIHQQRKQSDAADSDEVGGVTARPPPEQQEDESGGEEMTLRVIFYQVFIPFLIAGFDNVGAGIILDHVQYWTVFKRIPELFILVASFLGLKGNLEMTLAARLATMANMGQLDKRENRWEIALGNLVLVQGQAIVVALLAALIAIFVNFLKEPDFDLNDCLLLLMTGLTTASITGLAMATLMFGATLLARKVGINPDNVSALIASIMGDIAAITMLSFSARGFYNIQSCLVYVGPMVLVGFLILLYFMLKMARRNYYTRDVVGTGWMSIITAMVISSVAGFVFDIAVGFFDTIAVVQPIINGVGGNLIAVQASRISTYFHLRCPLGQLPHEEDEVEDGAAPSSTESAVKLVEKSYRKSCPSPFTAFIGRHTNVRTARLLLLMSIPIHVVYFFLVHIIKSGSSPPLTMLFTMAYLLVVLVQISSLLYMAHIIVPFLWRRKLDPDNSAIPALMACADLLGAVLLTAAYFTLRGLGDPYVVMSSTDTLSSLSPTLETVVEVAFFTQL